MSASSRVQYKSEGSDIGDDTAFWPCVEMMCFPCGGWYSCIQGMKFSKLTDFQQHGSVVFVPLGCPLCRNPKQHLYELRNAAYVPYKARIPAVNNPGMS